MTDNTDALKALHLKIDELHALWRAMYKHSVQISFVAELASITTHIESLLVEID